MPTEDGTPVVNTVAETQVAAPTESTPVETKAPVLDEDGIDISFAQDDGSDKDSDEPTESKTEETQQEEVETESVDTPEEKVSKGEVRKDQLNTEIRDLVAERNRIRQEVEQLNAQFYKPASVDELTEQVNPETGEYYNRVEAKLEALEQAQQVERYNNQVAESRLAISSETARAIQDFPMFNAQSPEYNPQVAADVDQILEENLIIDKNTGQWIGSNISPYKLLKTVANAYNSSAVKTAANGQRAVEKMQAQADIPSSAPVKTTQKDDAKLDAEAYAKKHGLKEFRY